MKMVIDRKVYDTGKALMLHGWDNGCLPGDFNYCEESLYVTAKGNYFLHGQGGAYSIYAETSSGGGAGYGHGIIPYNEEDAIEWLECHDGHHVLMEKFSGHIEEA